MIGVGLWVVVGLCVCVLLCVLLTGVMGCGFMTLNCDRHGSLGCGGFLCVCVCVCFALCFACQRDGLWVCDFGL